jgi:hypothetical protein
MFDLHQNILLIEETTNASSGQKIAISSLDKLSGDIAAMCSKYSVSNVKLLGDKAYANSLIEDIYTAAKINYNLNDIKVEVI